jgi:Flp pilus assembly pilin Flp
MAIVNNWLNKLWQASPQRAGRGAKFTKAIAAFETATQAPFCGRLLRDQKGQDMTEYALISGLVASMTVALVPDMIEVALHIVSTFQNVAQIAMHAAGLE